MTLGEAMLTLALLPTAEIESRVMLTAVSRAIKLVQRNPTRAWLMARMAGWVFVLSGVVKVLSLPAALQLLSPNARHTEAALANDELATAIDAVLGANFLMFKRSCWKRAAVLHRYLSLSGVPTTIVFGLRKEDGALKGHAWLQSSGEPVLEKRFPAYTVTYSFPSTQAFDGDLAMMTSSGSEPELERSS
jgi:hypothetical protein